MAAPVDHTSTTALIREHLQWAWTDMDDLLLKVIPLIPPGKALREYTMARASYLKNNPGEGNINRRQLTEDEKIASGARAIVSKTVSYMIRKGEVDRRDDDRREVRRRPVLDDHGDCVGCGRPFDLAEMISRTPPHSKTTNVIPIWVKADWGYPHNRRNRRISR